MMVFISKGKITLFIRLSGIIINLYQLWIGAVLALSAAVTSAVKPSAGLKALGRL